MSKLPQEKLYCYVDEAGQDDASSVFVVVAVVSSENQDDLRQSLIGIERRSGTKGRKWHKSHPTRRLRYLDLVIEKNIASGDIFFNSYPKPLTYMIPFADVLERAIKAKVSTAYSARIFIDGIDLAKAGELTSALRVCNITLDMIKSRRDESEPLIRLADMWAGCIRATSLGSGAEQKLLERAINLRRVIRLETDG